MNTHSLDSIKRTLTTEANGLQDLLAVLDGPLSAPLSNALTAIAETSGRLIVTGMGKSGHIAAKLAATFASTGTPAFFVHPAEASHGDLGMITKDDVILALSWSGETAELGNLVEYSRRYNVVLIAITSNLNSALAKAADIKLVLPKSEEACPLGLAPTTSTLLQMAIGDAMAVALLEGKKFTADDFGKFHPGGKLGAGLKYISEIMHSGQSIPLLISGTSMKEGLVTMTTKGFGTLGIIDGDGKLVGMITDGDLRRHLEDDLLSLSVDQVMTINPLTIPPDMLASKALDVLNQSTVTAIFVVEEGIPKGVLHIHDLLRFGVA